MNLHYSVAGEVFSASFEGDDLTKLIHDATAHFSEHHPVIASNPEFSVRVIEAVVSGLALDEADIHLEIE